MPQPANISDALTRMAQAQSDAVALRVPCGRDAHRALTYRELADDVEAIAAGLAAIGIGAGARTVLMVRPSVELFALMFALFRAGAVPVLVDPGIDRRALKACLDEAQPHAFIGIPLAHAARIVLRWARGARVLVTVGRRWFWGGHTLQRVRALGSSRLKPLPQGGFVGAASAANDLAALLFTSGSTGIPKGVEYTHANFAAQVDMIRDAFAIAPGEVDLPTFPPFALFDPALGMTSVVPDMDPTRPAHADPATLIATIERYGCTTMFGSPALLDTLARGAAARGTKLRTLRRVISAGAPVRPDVVERAYAMLPEDARIWTPYGATECLPVAAIEGREILALRERTERGEGICVGRPVAPNLVRVIAITDEPIARWDAARELSVGEVGEITVAGPTVTRAYFARERATALAKVSEALPDGTTRIVHRMGDLGCFDAEGRLWYVGRKSHRVETASGPLYTEMVEGVFNTHASVRRSALVGIGAPGAQQPVVCIELAAGVPASDWPRIRDELRTLAQRHALTRTLGDFRRHPAFPVDIRHNAKIGRERLAVWVLRGPGD